MSNTNNSDEIAKRITEVAKADLPNAINRALERACLVIEGSAKSKCPVKTANLRNSITHKVVLSETTGYVGTNVEYAPYVEIGTGRRSSRGDGNPNIQGQRPQPFLKPARDNNLSAIQKCFEGII